MWFILFFSLPILGVSHNLPDPSNLPGVDPSRALEVIRPSNESANDHASVVVTINEDNHQSFHNHNINMNGNILENLIRQRHLSTEERLSQRNKQLAVAIVGFFTSVVAAIASITVSINQCS